MIRISRVCIAALIGWICVAPSFAGTRSITVTGILRTGPTGINTTTNPDLIGTPVTSVTQFIPGNQVYYEIWVTTEWEQGLTGVGVDVDYDSGFLSTSTAQVSLNSAWGLLAFCPENEECVRTPGLVNNVGGNNISGLPASLGLWERIATIEFDVTSQPDPCTGFALLQDGQMLFAFFGGGLALPSEVTYESLGVPGPDYIDIDSDFVIDCLDNCPTLFNPSQADCDSDGLGDACTIADGIDTDCNSNTIPDMCDIDAGAIDENNNGFPDECEICERDCDCYTDQMGQPLPFFVGACRYRYCIDNLCQTCERRFGNTCAPYASVVQTNDILCSVTGFGNYCACPNADLWDGGAPGCSSGSPENCEGPSGRPISTADILATVQAFGGNNPFSCPCIPIPMTTTCDFTNGCDQAPLSPAAACGPSVASASVNNSSTTTASTHKSRQPSVGHSPVTVFVVPRTRQITAGSEIEADVFISGNTTLSALEVAFDTRGGNQGKLTLVDVYSDADRQDHLSQIGSSVTATDLNLGRVGLVDLGVGIQLFEDESNYVATFVFEASEDARGIFMIQPATELFEMWADLGVAVDFQIASDAAIVVGPPSRR